MGRFPVLSLFCGVGGLDLGFEEAGFQPLLALDNSSAAVESYNVNRPGRGEPAKIFDLANAQPDMIIDWWQELAGDGIGPVGIIGGPPCQAFSVANAHKSPHDPRAKLALEYARIFKAFHGEFNLDFFVFENVVGLARKTHSEWFAVLVGCFEENGFDVVPLFLDAVDFGVPQYRRRLFLVGFNRQRFTASDFQQPRGKRSKTTVREAIGGLPAPMFYKRQGRPSDIGLHPNHWCMNPRSVKFRNGTIKSGEMKGRSFRRLAWDVPSWTVSYGHREVHVHPSGDRRLSVYEAMLIQGFPSRYQLCGTLSQQIQMVSDAVPPPLARSLAETVKEFLLSDGPVTEDDKQLSRNGHWSHLGVEGLHTIAPKSTSP